MLASPKEIHTYIHTYERGMINQFFVVELNFWGKYIYAVHTIESGKLNWEIIETLYVSRFLC